MVEFDWMCFSSFVELDLSELVKKITSSIKLRVAGFINWNLQLDFFSLRYDLKRF
jgi:hypothetical protein